MNRQDWEGCEGPLFYPMPGGIGTGDGMRVLRNLGKDTFVLSGDVLACLKGAGLDVDKGSSKPRRNSPQPRSSCTYTRRLVALLDALVLALAGLPSPK